MYVIGVDPGPLPGVVALRLLDQRARIRLDRAYQVKPYLLEQYLDDLTSELELPYPEQFIVAVERFVVGTRASRSRAAQDGAVTRDMVGAVKAWGRARNVQVHNRSAAEVKPWATDIRLEAAGLLAPTKGMRHARDGARHALFCAVKDYGLPDPLSSKAGGA